jgi:ABC-type polysaccharide/polyol phosphate export permease
LKGLQYVYLFNPITPIVMTFQRAIYGKTQYSYLPPGTEKPDRLPRPPHLGGRDLCGILVGACWSSAWGLFLLALIVFGRLEGNFAEEL